MTGSSRPHLPESVPDDRDLPADAIDSIQVRLRGPATKVCYSPTIIGANISFRKTVLTAIRGFDPVLGPGAICKAAEDLDLVYRSLRGGFKIVYSPDVAVSHNHGRRTEADENRTSFAYAFGRGALYCKHVMRFDFQIARVAAKELYGLTKTLAKGVSTRTKFPYHRLVFPAFFLGAISYCRARLFPGQLLNPSLPEPTHAKRQTV